MEAFVRNKIEINTPATAVWEALVKPELTKIYMFGCETVSDWKPGSELLWKAQVNGQDIVYVKGKVVEIHVPQLLKYTVIDPHSKELKDVPENYLTVTYELEEHNGVTTLTVSQGDFTKVGMGEQRYKDVYNNGQGWEPILKDIKTLVEQGRAGVH